MGRAYRKKDGDDSAAPRPSPTTHDDDDTAWYLAHKGRSQISMDDLKGETSLIVQRMVKGFYLGLDKEIHAFSGTFWRTTRGMFVPKEHVLVHDPKVEFEGVWLNAPGETRHLPLGWITNPHQWKYTFDDGQDAPERARRSLHDRAAHGQEAGRRGQVVLGDGRRLVDARDGRHRDQSGPPARGTSRPASSGST